MKCGKSESERKDEMMGGYMPNYSKNHGTLEIPSYTVEYHDQCLCSLKE